MASGLRWTPEQLDAVVKRGSVSIAGAESERTSLLPGELGHPSALTTPAPSAPHDRRNDTERAYAEQVLDPMLRAGQILDYLFESVNLRLGHNTHYRPDFFVVFPDRFRFDEVKGHWREDARVKIKAASTRFPWIEFVAVTKRRVRDGGGWAYEHFKAA